jgi:hypothetical protein
MMTCNPIYSTRQKKRIVTMVKCRCVDAAPKGVQDFLLDFVVEFCGNEKAKADQTGRPSVAFG